MTEPVFSTTPPAVSSSGMPTAVEVATEIATATPITSGSVQGVALPRLASLNKDNIAFGDNGAIKAPNGERLFTARPRLSPNKATSQTDVWRDSRASRGQHAFIKLLTSNSSQSTSYATQRGALGGGYATKLTGDGSPVASMVSKDTASGYDSFILTSVSCNMSEKLQVTEVFGDNEVAYFFGRQPITFTIGGVLIDSRDNEWFTDWLSMYSAVLRGSQLAQRNQLLRLVLPNMVLTGTIASTSWSQDSSSDVSIPFYFTFLAKRVEPLSVAESDQLAQNLIDFSKAQDFISQQQIASLKSALSALTGAVKDPSTTVAKLGSALYSSSRSASMAGVIDSVKGFKSQVDNFAATNPFTSWLSGQSSLFNTNSSALNGVRMQLFSPIYGVLTSLTKLVQKTFGDLTKIFTSLTSTVKNILRDIKNIANQAVGLVKLVNSNIKGLGRTIKSEISSTKKLFNSTMKSLGKAAGAIATSPITVLQSTKSMFSTGGLGGSAKVPAFLKDNKKASMSSAVAAFSKIGANYKIALLQGSPGPSAKGGAKL